jgi:hypothetical protein
MRTTINSKIYTYFWNQVLLSLKKLFFTFNITLPEFNTSLWLFKDYNLLNVRYGLMTVGIHVTKLY